MSMPDPQSFRARSCRGGLRRLTRRHPFGPAPGVPVSVPGTGRDMKALVNSCMRSTANPPCVAPE
ncbi:hypothetical protein CGZ69_04785 [Streptomyces peucetius subsp. caesius ATCC 27952]|nr:hypothetical protein CGZ69_04785 [Streptomyces peucetius subsp. caesius ATCC 27952]